MGIDLLPIPCLAYLTSEFACLVPYLIYPIHVLICVIPYLAFRILVFPCQFLIGLPDVDCFAYLI